MKAPRAAVAAASFRVAVLASVVAAGAARAEEPAGAGGGFEPVVEHAVKSGETCADVARALYGDAKLARLVTRYNRVACSKGAIEAGLTLVMPAKPGESPAGRVKNGPAIGFDASAGAGDVVGAGTTVSTDATSLAEVTLTDRTRVRAAPNTKIVLHGSDTADQPEVELTSGEIVVGVPPRGHGDAPDVPARVGVEGGAHVESTAPETLVVHVEHRTLVEAIGGTAVVESGGKRISLAAGTVTSFDDGSRPPAAQPMAAAPTLRDDAAPGVELAPAGAGILRVAWGHVDAAAGYRVEVAADASFDRLLARRDVDAATTTDGFEHVPTGIYFVRVRTIGADGSVSAATKPIALGIVEATLDRGTGQIAASLVASPYVILRFAPVRDVELAIGEGSFQPLPETLDLGATRPKKLRFRIAGEDATTTELPVEYTHVTAEIRLVEQRAADHARLQVIVHGVEGVDVRKILAPKARIHRGETVDRVALDPVQKDVGEPTFTTFVDHPSEVTQIEILDSDGNVIGSTEPSHLSTGPHGAPPPPPDDRSRIGVTAPPFSLSPYGIPLWWSPTPENAGSVGAVAEGDFHGGAADFSGKLLATGLLGPVGFEIALRADAFRHLRASDPGGWVGARVRVAGGKKGRIEAGPALRVGFPVTKFSYPARIEGGFAVGQEIGPWSWLVDVGTRFQLQDEALGAFTEPLLTVGGGTLDVNEWLRVEAIVDAEVAMDSTDHQCVLCKDDSAHPAGGFSLGLEAGTTIFGSVTGRISPFAAQYGNVSATAVIGVRAQ